MNRLNPDVKVQKLSREEARILFGQIFHDGMYFWPILTPDMDIVITEEEVKLADKKQFTFLDESKLVYPAELSKQSLDEQAQLEAQKADIENNLAEVEAKLAEVVKSSQIETQK